MQSISLIKFIAVEGCDSQKGINCPNDIRHWWLEAGRKYMLEFKFMATMDLLLTTLWMCPHDLLQGEHDEQQK